MVAAYITQKQVITNMCNDGAILEEILQDWLVHICGIDDKKNANLTLQKAVEITQGMLTAARSVKEFQSANTDPRHTRAPGEPGRTLIRCYCCGKNNHATACPVLIYQ